MSRYLFGGFSRCLYPTQKFQSDAERKLAVILEREALKWFKPTRGQFQLFYRSGIDDQEYQPDFVAETTSQILMMEPKASNQMQDPDVLAKRDVAIEWCRHATTHAASYGGKPWSYLLIPHNSIAENMTIDVWLKPPRKGGSAFRRKHVDTTRVMIGIWSIPPERDLLRIAVVSLAARRAKPDTRIAHAGTVTLIVNLQIK